MTIKLSLLQKKIKCIFNIWSICFPITTCYRKNHPSKKNYKIMPRYQNIKIIKKVSIKIVEDFFKSFPEEKRGRKNFKNKEKEIMTL